MNNPTASGGVSIAGPDGESPPQADGVLTQRVINFDCSTHHLISAYVIRRKSNIASSQFDGNICLADKFYQEVRQLQQFRWAHCRGRRVCACFPILNELNASRRRLKWVGKSVYS